MNAANRKTGTIIKVILGAFAALFVVAIAAVVIQLTLLNQHTNKKRNQLSDAFASTSLPASLKLDHRTAAGDGLDSAPSWEYTYVISTDPATALKQVRDSLTSQGYTVYTDHPSRNGDPAMQPFWAKKGMLKLFVDSQSNHTYITVEHT